MLKIVLEFINHHASVFLDWQRHIWELPNEQQTLLWALVATNIVGTQYQMHPYGEKKSSKLGLSLEFYNKLTNNFFTLTFHKCHNLYVYRYWTKPHYYKKWDLWLGKCNHFMEIQLHDYVVNSNSLILP